MKRISCCLLVCLMIIVFAISAFAGDIAKKAQTKEKTSLVSVGVPPALSRQAETIVNEIHQGIKNSIPEVAGAIGRAIFWRNLAFLLKDFFIAVFFVFFVIYYFKKLAKPFWAWAKDIADTEYDGEAAYVLPIVTIVALVIFGVAFFCNTQLFDARCWMGVFDQKAYLANIVLEKMKLFR